MRVTALNYGARGVRQGECCARMPSQVPSSRAPTLPTSDRVDENLAVGVFLVDAHKVVAVRRRVQLAGVLAARARAVGVDGVTPAGVEAQPLAALSGISV